MLRLPSYINRTLSVRLSLLVVPTLAILLMASLAVMLYYSRKTLKEEALEKASQTLESTVQHIDNLLLSVEQASGNIYFAILPHLNQPEVIQKYCQKLVKCNRYIDGCSINFKPTEKMAPQWEVPHVTNSEASNRFITFSLPIHDASSKPIGEMNVEVSLSRLSKIILSAKPSPNSYCTLLTTEGSFIVHPDSNKLQQNSFTQMNLRADNKAIEAVKAMVSGETGYKPFHLNGNDYLVFYKPFKRGLVRGRSITGPNWSVGIIYPKDDIFGDYNRLIYYVLAISVVGLILLLVSSSVIIHRQLLPLRLLTESARRIAKGNYSETIPDSQQQDEIGQLQDHFRQMQQSLATNVGELEQLTATLEERGKGLHDTYIKAKKADQMKIAFLHNMTDQMIEPANTILNDVNALCDFEHSQGKEEASRLTDDIQHQGKVITELLNNLLLMSEEEIEKEVAHE